MNLEHEQRRDPNLARGARTLLLLALGLGGCFVFLPEPHDRKELALSDERDTCGRLGSETIVDPRVIAPSAIERVEPLYSIGPSRSGHDTHFVGAKLRMPPTPGMTAELLERTLRCHAARTTLGKTASPKELDRSPYVLPNGWVKIRAFSEDGGFTVKLSSHEHAAAEEILARARAYVEASPTPSTTARD